MPLPGRPRTRSGGRFCAYADISPDFSGPSISLSIVIRTRQCGFHRIGLRVVAGVPPMVNAGLILRDNWTPSVTRSGSDEPAGLTNRCLARRTPQLDGFPAGIPTRQRPDAMRRRPPW